LKEFKKEKKASVIFYWRSLSYKLFERLRCSFAKEKTFTFKRDLPEVFAFTFKDFELFVFKRATARTNVKRIGVTLCQISVLAVALTRLERLE
jgi:hypothetical protein